MYTRCPNCDSHFEITQEYLDIANGKVRCGHCDHIFNALENLYEQPLETDETATATEEEPELNLEQPESSEPAAESPASQDSISDTASESGPDKAETDAFTAPSIDIKAKMERIAASLSAATQELKTARKASIFGQEPEVQPAATESTEAAESEISKVPEEPVQNDFPSSSVESAEAVESFEPPGDKAQEPEAESLDTEATTSDDRPAAVEDALEILHIDETAVQPSIETAETSDESSGNTEEAAIEETVAEPPPETMTDDAMGTEEQEQEINVEEEELELIDFRDQAEEDSYSEPVSDFTTRKVDQDDIDILKSLIDEPEGSDQLKNEGLLDELDNINQTLSDEMDSLDEELSGSDSDLDDIDNGDDLLAELEQLEKDFINSEQLPANASLDEAFIADDDVQDRQSEYDDIDETSLTEQQSTDEALSGDTQAEKSSEKLTDDEVVPSFLTQSNAHSSNPRAMFAWLAGTVILLLVLTAQYLHVNSINLAQNSTFRPFLESLCPMTGCALPLIKAPTKIITTDHDVRTHPKINNALEIQLTFKNKATFTQGYPILEIIFSNSRGAVVARRKFTPDEYLTADIQYLHGMKSNQSQDVRLKIVDPDPSSLLSFQFNYY